MNKIPCKYQRLFIHLLNQKVYCVNGDSETSEVKIHSLGASLVVQWLRICLLMQGTRVRALVWEDPTCRGATRPMSHSY